MSLSPEDVTQIINSIIPVVSQYALRLFGALAIIVIGWWIAGWAERWVRKALDRISRMDETLKPFISSAARYLVLIFVIVGVLNQFGVQTASIIAVLGAAGLAVGLALQGTLSNVAAGVMLLMLRPFRAGDYIDAGGVTGTVREIGLFSTEFTTPQGVSIVAPNGTLWGAAIINYSRNPTQRADVSVGIAYGDNIEDARAAMMRLMARDERVNRHPEPRVVVTFLGDNAVNLQMRCWANTDVFWSVYFDLIEGAKTAVEDAGCSIPFPQRDVHIVTSSRHDGPTSS